MRTVAALDNRSERTWQLAIEAKIEDVGSLQRLVSESDVLLSVLVPAAATEAAKQVGEAISNVGKNLLYVDCNAIALIFRSTEGIKKLHSQSQLLIG